MKKVLFFSTIVLGFSVSDTFAADSNAIIGLDLSSSSPNIELHAVKPPAVIHHLSSCGTENIMYYDNTPSNDEILCDAMDFDAMDCGGEGCGPQV